MAYAVKQSYIDLLRHAQRFSKRPDEAEDLLQNVLLSAIEAGRADLSCPDNRRWMIGALRKRALFEARSAVRRKNRETDFESEEPTSNVQESMPLHFISTLPASLRTTTLLVLTGHTKEEIIYLLRISDTAFRKRISEIRKRWGAIKGTAFEEFPGLDSTLPLGRIRQVLIGTVKSEDAILASHDPDGNLFIVCSQKPDPRQHGGTTKSKEE